MTQKDKVTMEKPSPYNVESSLWELRLGVNPSSHCHLGFLSHTCSVSLCSAHLSPDLNANMQRLPAVHNLQQRVTIVSQRQNISQCTGQEDPTDISNDPSRSSRVMSLDIFSGYCNPVDKWYKFGQAGPYYALMIIPLRAFQKLQNSSWDLWSLFLTVFACPPRSC